MPSPKLAGVDPDPIKEGRRPDTLELPRGSGWPTNPAVGGQPEARAGATAPRGGGGREGGTAEPAPPIEVAGSQGSEGRNDEPPPAADGRVPSDPKAEVPASSAMAASAQERSSRRSHSSLAAQAS